MIHLFNKVYLGHESMYDSLTESLLVFSNRKVHPVSRLFGLEAGEMPSYEEVLASKFGGKKDAMWMQLLQKDPTKRFNLFVDAALMPRLLIEFWKSIFKDPSAESLYRLYNFFVLDGRLKTYLFQDVLENSRHEFSNEIHYIPWDEFEALYKQAEPILALRKVDKTPFSFEFLMATRFANPQSKWTFAFAHKLKRLAWKRWCSDAEILKSEILNSFYDIRKLVPSAQVDFESVVSIEDAILKEPMLRWILDENFKDSNPEYIRATYDKEIFNQLQIALHKIRKPSKVDPNSNGHSLTSDEFLILLTDHVFEERYEDYLKLDIQRGVGCAFTNEVLRQKSNQLFPCYVYDKIRQGRTDDLKEYELV